MAISQATTFPKGVFQTLTLSDTALPVGGGLAGSVKVLEGRLQGGAAAEIVIFRRPSAGAEYFRVPLAIGQVVDNLFAFDFVDGLEVVCASTAGDVHVTLTYFNG